MPETRIRIDEFNQYAWAEIQYLYEFANSPGSLQQRTIFYDDGTVREEDFQAGIRLMMRQTDAPDGAKPWEFIETTYGPTGQIDRRFTYFDDGTTREEYFLDTLRTQTTENDALDAADWEFIETRYDFAGRLEYRITYMDDGASREEYWLNGLRTSIREQDSFDGSAPWEFIDSVYDFNGRLEFRYTQFDSGLTREEQFQDGLRTSIRETDGFDSFGWETIETYYNPFGQIEFKLTSYDNGSSRTETYLDGQLTEVRMDEGFSGFETAWRSITTYYGPQGQIEYKMTEYDDGRMATEEYQDGMRVSTHTIDQFNTRTWAESFVFYDMDGARAAQAVLMDSGDATASYFEDGEIAARHYYDGDGSAPWFGRVLGYKDGVLVSDSRYYDPSELPPDFFDLPGEPPFLFVGL